MIGLTVQSKVRPGDRSPKLAKQMAVGLSADCVVSLGGGLVIDLAKAIALMLAAGDDFQAMKTRFSPGERSLIPRFDHTKLPDTNIVSLRYQ